MKEFLYMHKTMGYAQRVLIRIEERQGYVSRIVAKNNWKEGSLLGQNMLKYLAHLIF